MTELLERIYENFEQSFRELQAATDLTRYQRAQQISSQADVLCRTHEGLEFLFGRVLQLDAAGFFKGTAWEDPRKQVPSLVKGTLLAGHPNSTYEILSELRILACALGHEGDVEMPSGEARTFLEEVVVHNLEFAFDELTEASRTKLTEQERNKVVGHFRFLLTNADLEGIKEKLADEMKMVCAQRPVVTHSTRNLIRTVHNRIDLDPDDPVDQRLQYYINAVFRPGPLSAAHRSPAEYREALRIAEPEALEDEARALGEYLHDTGLTNPWLAMLLRYAVDNESGLVPLLLRLSPRGITEWERYRSFVGDLVMETFSEHNYRGIYGLKRMLERSLFSRQAVRSGLTNLKLVNINSQARKNIVKSVTEPSDRVTAGQYLMGALISVLGQPLGIGQGNNATCQSARGISMWAQHSPAKLINMITTVATANNLILRFENDDLESLKLGKGLVEKLDYDLDAVSVLLVPHLDKIYNEMMRRSAGRGEDPHKWTNPALYGGWVQDGFASAYSYLTNSIQDFEGFVRLFYAGFHPEYNGGREMVYPNPVGIFITSSKGDMLGFHAVSLLRVMPNRAKENGEVRAYFLNPNNEGRQDWGQGIRPTVYGNGEKHGESSLPVHQFVARVYAFHFNSLAVNDHLASVPSEEIQRVEKLAKESWGRAYQWSNLKKTW